MRLSRRTVLRGIGTAVSLPMLEAMCPLGALAQSVAKKNRPNRMAFVFVPNGANMKHWTPSGEGALNELPTILQPLDEVKEYVNVLTGLAQRNAFALGDGPGDHARSTAVWLTGVHPKKTSGADIKVGISADQLAAQRVGSKTRFPSLEIGCERGAGAGDCDSGYSCAYSSNISWRSENTPVAKEVNPRLVFERLFGAGDESGQAESKARRERYDKSILDLVLEDAASLRLKLGLRDQRKLDDYLEGVREIEKRLLRVEAQNAEQIGMAHPKPAGVPRDYAEHVRLLGDMMVLAFQADLTRICTFMLANDGSNRGFGAIGISEGHHDISHHGLDPGKLEKKRQIDRYQVAQLAYIHKKMKSVDELDGSLLDNTMLVYGGGISDGDRHNHDDLPILLCGRGAGTIKSGVHRRFPHNTPMNNLFLSLIDRMGIPAETLGDSTGKLQGLL